MFTTTLTVLTLLNPSLPPSPRLEDGALNPTDATSRTEESYEDASGAYTVTRHARPPNALSTSRGRASFVHAATQRTFEAEFDNHAIVQVPSPADARNHLAALGLQATAALMPSAGLFRVVDSAGTRDGLALAADLQAAVKAGLLTQASPDLYLAKQTNDIPIPPNDPRYGGQWYLANIGIEQAWGLSDGDPGTTVVVIDNGCDLQHPDLQANLDPGLDVIDNDDVAGHAPGVDGNAHGTACAGIVAAVGHNNEGITGVCPECRIRCVRLLGELTPVSADVAAMRYALDVDAAVVSNSWSYINGAPAPGAMVTAIQEVRTMARDGRGAVVVFAAGNENRRINPGEVAALDGVLTVGAVSNFDEATAFTNEGAQIDVSAPTGTVTTDVQGPDGSDDGDYTNRFGGTSAACPVAAGVAALLASGDPDATESEIRDAIVTTTRPAPFAVPDATGHDETYGFGIIEPAAALRKLLDIPQPTTDAGVGNGGPDAGTNDGGVIDEEGDGGDGCTCVGAVRRPVLSWLGLLLLVPVAMHGRYRRGLRRPLN